MNLKNIILIVIITLVKEQEDIKGTLSNHYLTVITGFIFGLMFFGFNLFSL